MTSCATRDFFASHRLSYRPTSETVEPGVRGTEAVFLLVERFVPWCPDEALPAVRRPLPQPSKQREGGGVRSWLGLYSFSAWLNLPGAFAEAKDSRCASQSSPIATHSPR
ncbi:hypothetical protein GCK32_007979 [Trichostrongylus colubriformis]|uniref:Uncharacterized protein n=1 Tax=Trichostrongylus colubriformis TaxID=6319 RepID=A0AAN8G357_TRICO